MHHNPLSGGGEEGVECISRADTVSGPSLIATGSQLHPTHPHRGLSFCIWLLRIATAFFLFAIYTICFTPPPTPQVSKSLLPRLIAASASLHPPSQCSTLAR